MRSIQKYLIYIFTLLVFVLLGLANFNTFAPSIAFAETEAEKLERLSKEIAEYEQEIEKLKSQAGTLSNQVAQYDAQIKLTTLKILQTEEKIALLGGRIGQLVDSLEVLNEAYEERVVASYKMSRVSETYAMLVASGGLDEFFNSYQYLKRIQGEDKNLLERLQNAQNAYEREKSDQEVLQDQLQSQQSVLGAQKTAKANLLQQTKNDERRYQQLLAQARSEFESIQAILAGKGDESEVGKVSQGERIASIIQGPSCNSNGSHLHFIVSNNRAVSNPFSYLLAGIDHENCSGSSCGSTDGDAFNPTGNWNWPISSKIKFTQGYGSTWATRNSWVGKIYSFHNGIDINSLASSEVKAVSPGTLYRGSYGGSGGCRLRYVRLHHDDTGIDTFYLHVNY